MWSWSPRPTWMRGAIGTRAAGNASSIAYVDVGASIGPVAPATRASQAGRAPSRAVLINRDGRWHGEMGGFRTEASTERRCVASLRRAAGVDADALIIEVVPELLGVAEAARLLGWDRRRIVTYVDRGAFPEPVAHLASGRVWRRSDIETFGATRRTTKARRRR